MKITSILVRFISLFSPERIVLDNDKVETWFLKTLKSTQQFDDVNSIYFSSKHDHTGGQVLNLTVNGKVQSYFEDQFGFSKLVKTTF